MKDFEFWDNDPKLSVSQENASQKVCQLPQSKWKLISYEEKSTQTDIDAPPVTDESFSYFKWHDPESIFKFDFDEFPN